MGTVKEYYNFEYDEWSRLERHRIEFEMTKRALGEFIDSNSEILDVGGGPGRYSIFLSKQGHKVTLFDLSEELVKQAEKNAADAGVVLDGIVQGDVLELDRLITNRLYDAVLCMGPMYHLLQEEERTKALKQCLDKLKPGGIIVISFISAYAPIIDCLKYDLESISNSKSRLLNYLTDGKNDNSFGFTDAYFINPDNIDDLLKDFKVSKLKLMATEGMGALIEPALMRLSEEAFQEWIDLFYRISDNEKLFGSCEHLLYVGRKDD